MNLTDCQKGWLTRLFALGSFVLLVFSGITFINPLVIDKNASDGVCKITSLTWFNDTCDRSSNIDNYYELPILQGVFVRLSGRPTVLPGQNFPKENFTVGNYRALYVNRSRSFNSDPIISQYQVTLFDDNSDNPLINCSSTDIVATKRVLVGYIPTLAEALDINSPVDHELKYYPDTYFNCTFLNGTDPSAFLKYQRAEKWTSLLFVLAIFMFIGGLMLIIKYDVDGPIKEFAGFLVGILYPVLTFVNAIFFFLMRVLIWHCIFGKDAGTPEEFFESGSVFSPLVWLFKHCNIFTSAGSQSPPATPPATRPASASPRAGEVSVSVQISRSRSRDARRSVSPAPSSSSSDGHLPRSQSMPRINIPATRTPPPAPEPNSRPHVSVSETFPSAPPEPSSRPHAPPTSSEEPPSYPAIYTEGTVLPNPVVLQYHSGDREDFDNEILPPPPSYDEAVSNR